VWLRPSECYGAEHLVRFLLEVPSILQTVPMQQDQYRQLTRVLSALVQWLTDRCDDDTPPLRKVSSKVKTENSNANGAEDKAAAAAAAAASPKSKKAKSSSSSSSSPSKAASSSSSSSSPSPKSAAGTPLVYFAWVYTDVKQNYLTKVAAKLLAETQAVSTFVKTAVQQAKQKEVLQARALAQQKNDEVTAAVLAKSAEASAAEAAAAQKKK
jgi:hypothetical protein